MDGITEGTMQGYFKQLINEKFCVGTGNVAIRSHEQESRIKSVWQALFLALAPSTINVEIVSTPRFQVQ